MSALTQVKLMSKILLLVFLIGILTQCKKKKEDPEPQASPPPPPDTDVQSCIDAATAAYIATDIDMMVAQSSEYSYMMFYSNLISSASNTVTVDPNFSSKIRYLYFNNALCMDGVVRNGTITISYSLNANNGAASTTEEFIRSPNHMALVSFQNFSVGKFVVDNSSYMTIKNTTPVGYTRSVTPLSWSIEGLLKFADTTNGGGSNAIDITWNGQFVKTLTNSTVNLIHPATSLPIKWITGVAGVPTSTSQYSSNHSLDPNGINGIVSYTGSATGVTTGSVTYQFNIPGANPLYRDYGCSPNFYNKPEKHPFSKGIAVFQPGSKTSRTVYFGDQQNNAYCDNDAIININGNIIAINLPY